MIKTEWVIVIQYASIYTLVLVEGALKCQTWKGPERIELILFYFPKVDNVMYSLTKTSLPNIQTLA